MVIQNRSMEPPKHEYIWPHNFANYQQAKTVISEAFLDYNRNRLHSALKYAQTDEFMTSWKRSISDGSRSV